MPIVHLVTNVSQDQIPKDFHTRLCALVADVLSKPPENVTVTVQGSVQMCRGLSDSPNALLTVLSINVFTIGKNSEFAAPLNSFLCKELGLEPERAIIYFQDVTLDQFPRPPK